MADFSSLYTDMLGPSGVECARQAVLDFAPQAKGLNAQVVFADHLNKPDVGATIARRWFDREGVDMLIAGPNSAVGLAAAAIAREKNKVCCGTAVTSSEFTGSQCTPNSINWSCDAYMLAKAVATQTVRAGGKSWYFITTDNAFGNSLQGETSRFVEAEGGRVVGSAKAPTGNADFSAMLVAAGSSGADVLGLAVAADDLTNALKQSQEFGLSQSMKVTALVVFLNDIHAAGLPVMQRLLFTNTFYWDLNDHTRAFTGRVLPRMAGAYPGMVHAGCYAVTMHYLKAVMALGIGQARQDGRAVVAQMKAMPSEDDAFGSATIREDGRAVLPAYLLQVKTPSESRKPWDYCSLVSTMQAGDTVKPLAEAGCPLVKP